MAAAHVIHGRPDHGLVPVTALRGGSRRPTQAWAVDFAVTRGFGVGVPASTSA